MSYKPQKISPKFEGTVRMLLQKKIKDTYMHPQFMTDVTKPLSIEPIIDQMVQNLSGGELQRVALVLCMGAPADIYLIDEPSAYLDSEQRVVAAKVIKRFILHAKKTGFIVEHDFIMATYPWKEKKEKKERRREEKKKKRKKREKKEGKKKG